MPMFNLGMGLVKWLSKQYKQAKKAEKKRKVIHEKKEMPEEDILTHLTGERKKQQKKYKKLNPNNLKRR